MSNLFYLPRAVPVTSNGRPIPNALANFYLTQTVTRATTYTNDARTVPHSNPVQADSSGVFPAIYLDPEIVYKLVLTEANGTLIYPVDPITSVSTTLTLEGETTPAEDTADAVVINNLYPECNPLRYGNNTVPGTTDMTAAIQMAMNVAQAKGGDTVEISAGTYLYTGNLRPPIAVDASARTFRIHGEGMEATKLVTNNASSIQIYGDDPPDGDNVQVSFDLDGFQITNTGTAHTGVGIDLYHCQRANIGNVRVVNFNYGIRARSTWNFTLGKRAQLDGNNVGFKVPIAGADHVGFNAAQISGLSCANNIKAGLSISGGNVVTIDDVLLESNPVGIYIPESMAHVRISTAYYEAGGITFTENNRDGTLAPFLLITGKDEDDYVGDTDLPIRDLQLGCMMDHAGEGVIQLENVDGVTFLNHEYGRNYIMMGSNVKNVRSPNIEGLNSISTPLVGNKSKSTARNVLRDLSQNWVPNGNWALPGLPYMAFTGSATAAVITSLEINGALARTLEITCPDGQTSCTVTIPIYVPTSAEYASAGSSIVGTLHGLADNADFSTVVISFFDAASTQLSGGGVKTTGLTTWHVLSAASNPNENIAQNNLLQIRITLLRTTGTGDAHYYLDELAVFPSSHAQLTTLSSLDTLVGLSGTVTASTTTGAAWFYGEVDTGLGSENYYRVIVTPIGVAETALSWRVNKMTGGDAGKFRVQASVDETVFEYLVIPTIMRAP